MITQTLTDFQNKKKDELIHSLLVVPGDNSDFQQIREFVAKAGRLAYLNEFQPLHNLEVIFQKEKVLSGFEKSLGSLFTDWLRNWVDFEGETLGNNIVFLQDFQGVLTYSNIPFSSVLKEQFENLVDLIGTPILDSEAKIILDDYNLFYPIPKEKRIPVLREPISVAMYLIEQMMRPRPQEKVWDTIWIPEDHCWEIHSEQGKKLLSVQWEQEEPPVFKVLNSRNQAVNSIKIMRIGTHPVTQDPENPKLWRAESRWLQVKPEAIQKKGLSVRFVNGSRAVFPVGEYVPTSVSTTQKSMPVSNTERFKYYASSTAMAAQTNESALNNFCFENTEHNVTINMYGGGKIVRFSEDINQTGKKFTKIRIFGHELQAIEEGFWSVSLEEFRSWYNKTIQLEVIANDGTSVEVKLKDE